MIDKTFFNPLKAAGAVQPNGPKEQTAGDVSRQFGQFLNEAMEQLREQGHEVDQLTLKAASGDLNDLHQLTIASEKAAIGLELTVQVRNKVIEAYQEIMRMQV